MRRFHIDLGLICLLVGCANLTCDKNVKESIVRANQGVNLAKAKAYGAAEKELETAVTLDPRNHFAAFNLGQVYSDQSKWDKAADAFAKAVKEIPDEAMYRYRLARALYESDKLDTAQTEFEEAIKLNNRLFKAHWYLGRIYYRQDKPQDAAKSWSEACRLNPGFGKPFVDLGKLYYSWDKLDEAARVLSQGAMYTRDPEDLTNVYYYLGMTYDAQKLYDKAAEAYLNAIQAKRENVEARLQAGLSYAAKGDKENAKKYLQEFLKMGGGQNQFNITVATERLGKLAWE